MMEILGGVLAIVGLILIVPAYAYILLALRAHMTDLNTKSALTNTMIAQYNINFIRGESAEIAEAKASKMIAEKK